MLLLLATHCHPKVHSNQTFRDGILCRAVLNGNTTRHFTRNAHGDGPSHRTPPSGRLRDTAPGRERARPSRSPTSPGPGPLQGRGGGGVRAPSTLTLSPWTRVGSAQVSRRGPPAGPTQTPPDGGGRAPLPHPTSLARHDPKPTSSLRISAPENRTAMAPMPPQSGSRALRNLQGGSCRAQGGGARAPPRGPRAGPGGWPAWPSAAR